VNKATQQKVQDRDDTAKMTMKEIYIQE